MTKYFRDGIFCCVDTYQIRFGISDTLTNCKHIFSFARTNYFVNAKNSVEFIVSVVWWLQLVSGNS